MSSTFKCNIKNQQLFTSQIKSKRALLKFTLQAGIFRPLLC